MGVAADELPMVPSRHTLSSRLNGTSVSLALAALRGIMAP
jgi:hypothetical protein